MNPQHFRQYIEFIACCMIGDELQYVKHLTKQSNLGNQTASEVLAASRAVKDLQSDVRTKIGRLHAYGFEVVSALCSTVINRSEQPFERSRYWIVCAISGAIDDDALMLHHNGRDVCVSGTFAGFFESLWVLFHLEDIEYSKICTFFAQNPDAMRQNISNRIQRYLASQDVNERLAGIFAKAAVVVNEYLDNTLLQVTQASLSTPVRAQVGDPKPVAPGLPGGRCEGDGDEGQ